MALYSMLGVLSKLMSFSPEAPRPTAANADQGASAKKKKRFRSHAEKRSQNMESPEAFFQPIFEAVRDAASSIADGLLLKALAISMAPHYL